MRFFTVAILILMTTFLMVPGNFAQKATYQNDPAQPATLEAPSVFEEVQEIPGSGELILSGTYAFAVLGGVALEDMSSGTTQLIAPATDDLNSTLQNIGFTFRFDGVNHTTFGANGNGFITLGAISTGSSFTNGIGTTANQPKIMPFWDDLCTGSTGQVHFKTIGSPGSRKLIVEYQNMKITRNGSCTSPVGNGTFQLWLFEGTGVVQFAYGAGTPATTADGGYSIGIQAASTTNFASVTTNGGTVSYAVANNAQLDAIPSGTSYTFSPNIPLAPTAMTFNSVTQTTLSVNWTDNAVNETGYLVERSTDGINFTSVGTPAANAITFADSGLLPGINYTYRVSALTEGASASLGGSQTTSPAGNISSGPGGLWSSPATWNGGVVPAAGDNVTIEDGDTVTIDTAAVALSVKVGNDAPFGNNKKGEVPEGGGATLQFESAAARSLTVSGNVSIGAGDIFRSSTGGTVTTHNLSVGGNLTNNGTLDFSTNADTAGAGITFTGASDNTFDGTGVVTDVRTITVNKGTSRDNDLVLSTTNFTVAGSSTDTANSGYLTITNGSFRISGTFTGNHRTFATAAYTIPATGGFWLSNPNYTVTAQTGSATVNGLLRVSNGTFNVGTAIDDSVAFAIGSTIIVEGGAINTAGRFGVGVAATTAINYTQSAGVITTCTVGSNSTTLACWDLGNSTNAGVVYSITGGTVVVQQASAAATGPRDYRLQSGATGTGTTVVTGGLVQFGNAATIGGVQAFDGAGVFPNFELDTTTAAHTFTMLAPVTWNNVSRNVNIETGGTMSIGSAVYLFNGSTFVNNGVFTANGAAANFVPFDPAANVVVSGSGTFSTITTAIGMQSASITFNQVNQWRVRAFRVFTGNIINANKVTLGNNDATVSIIQFGNTTTPTLAGTFDVAPVFDLGTGGQTITYLRTGNIRTTGPEVNPARTLVSMTYDNNDLATNQLNIAGGDITLTGTTAALALTNGRVITGSNTLILSNTAGTTTRTAGLVDGNLRKSYSAAASKSFEVGSANGFSPVTVNVTAGTFPATFTVKAVQGPHPNFANPSVALQRYWTVTNNAGGSTADLTFNYLDPTDILTPADEALFVMFKYDGAFTTPGGTVNPAGNSATITGLTSFSDWTLARSSATTASGVTVGGRAVTAEGRGLRGARVTMIDSNGVARSTLTGALGRFQFDDVEPGQTYVVSVLSRRFTFSPRVVQVNDNISDLSFIAGQ